MTDLFPKIAYVLLLIVSLTGCPATGSLGVPAGVTGVRGADSPPDVSDLKGDDSFRETAPEAAPFPEASPFQKAGPEKAEQSQYFAIAKPHPGGVSSPGAEVGDEDLITAEGTIQPVCRFSSGEVNYRIKGSLHVDGHETTGCIYNTSTGERRCFFDRLQIRFWDGKTCRSEDLSLNLGKFKDWIMAREISSLSVRLKAAPKTDFEPMKPLTPSPSDESGTDTSDAPAMSPIQELAQKTEFTAPQQVLAWQPSLCGGFSQESGENLEVLPITPDLPDCDALFGTLPAVPGLPLIK